MGLIDVASGNSVWRGMDYYEEHKVISWKKTGESEYDGSVSGSSGNSYTVHIDVAHPRRSACNCPFAEGRRVVCKHMIALYFTAVPEAVEDFQEQVKQWEREEEEREKQHLRDVRKYVNSLKKEELREQLYNAMLELEELRKYRW